MSIYIHTFADVKTHENMKFEINDKADITDVIINENVVNSENATTIDRGTPREKIEQPEVVIDTSGMKKEVEQEQTKLESGSVSDFSDILKKTVKSSEASNNEKTTEENKKSYENLGSSEFSDMKASEYKEKFIKEENYDPTIGDLEAEAESMFDIFDTIVIFFISVFAKDKYESNYQLSLEKKKRIVRAITRWLIVRKKSIMPAWLSMVIVAGTAYMGSFKRARENRMKVLNEGSKPIEVKARTVREEKTEVKETREEKPEVKKSSVSEDIKKEISGLKVKRSQGRPKKNLE